MDLAASAVGRDALVRQPDVRRQSSGLPEQVDRYSAARGPVAADAEVRWLESRRDAFADYECAFLVDFHWQVGGIARGVAEGSLPITVNRGRCASPNCGAGRFCFLLIFELGRPLDYRTDICASRI